VHERHRELKEELIRRKLPVKEIGDLQQEICKITGTPRPLQFGDEIVALVEYRDGSIIDVVRRVKD
jgi:citrate lyase subunit alpha / citrate CoA-transferase